MDLKSLIEEAENKIGQESLSNLLGVSTRSIRHYKLGSRKPTEDKINALKEVIKITEKFDSNVNVRKRGQTAEAVHRESLIKRKITTTIKESFKTVNGKTYQKEIDTKNLKKVIDIENSIKKGFKELAQKITKEDRKKYGFGFLSMEVESNNKVKDSKGKYTDLNTLINYTEKIINMQLRLKDFTKYAKKTKMNKNIKVMIYFNLRRYK